MCSVISVNCAIKSIFRQGDYDAGTMNLPVERPKLLAPKQNTRKIKRKKGNVSACATQPTPGANASSVVPLAIYMNWMCRKCLYYCSIGGISQLTDGISHSQFVVLFSPHLPQRV